MPIPTQIDAIRELIQRKKRLIWRLASFGVGGVLSVAINVQVFHFLARTCSWKEPVAYLCSLLASNLLLFLWNYFCGFRTQSTIAECASKQVVITGGSNLLNYVLVLALGAVLPDAWMTYIIITVQVGIAGGKFLAYHYWVYPDTHKSSASCGPAVGS